MQAGKKDVRSREEMHVLFRASGTTFAMPCGDVREVVPYVRPVPVPHSPPYIAGIINYCGQVCPVISLNGLNGCLKTAVGIKTRVIMLESPWNSQIRIGMLADRFIGSIKLSPDEVSAYEGQIDGLNAGCITGEAQINDATAVIFRPFEFLKELDCIYVK